MQKRHDAVLDTQGRPISGATVRVSTYPAGALATIYSDDGVTAKSNPMVTDSAGYFEYYAANGHYSWIITTTTSTKTINDILHDDSLTTNQQFVVATGTGNAMVVAAFSVGYTLADGDEVRVRAPGANTVTNPTISLPGAGVLTIYKDGGSALASGDVYAAGHEITIRYRASPARAELVPAGSSLQLRLAASDGSSLIGFIQTGIGSLIRTIQSKLRDWKFVEDWGASTSGTAAANVTAIQAAINAVALTGDILHFGPGNYNINDALNFTPYASLKGTHVIGAGGTTITQTDATKNIFNFPDQATANDIQSVRLSDIVLSGGARQMYLPNGGVWVTLENITFSNPVEAGIYAKGFVQEWFCRDLDFINGDYGIYHVGAGTASIWELDKCNFYSVYCHGQNINAIKHAIRDPVTVGVAGSMTHDTWTDLRIVRSKQDGMVIGAAGSGLTIVGFSTEGNGWTNNAPAKVYSTCNTTATSVTVTVAELAGFVVGDQVTLQNCGEPSPGAADEYDFVSTIVSKSAASGAGTMDLADAVTRSRIGAVITNGQYADIKFLTGGGFVGATTSVALINPQFSAQQSGSSLRYAVDGVYCQNLTIENGVTAGGVNAPVYGDPVSVSGNITVRRTTWTEDFQAAKVSNVPIGDVAYGSLGTDAVHVSGTLYLAELVLPKRFQITGIGVLNGSVVGNDRVIYGLYNSSGNLVANTTAAVGTLTAGANAFQEIDLTTPYKAVAGRYYIVVTCNGGTDRTRRIAANTFIHSRTSTIAGVFGTLPNGQTMPTTIVADAGPIAYVY